MKRVMCCVVPARRAPAEGLSTGDMASHYIHPPSHSPILCSNAHSLSSCPWHQRCAQPGTDSPPPQGLGTPTAHHSTRSTAPVPTPDATPSGTTGNLLRVLGWRHPVLGHRWAPTPSCWGKACHPPAASLGLLSSGEGTAPPSARQCLCWGAQMQDDGLTPMGPARPSAPACLPFSEHGGAGREGWEWVSSAGTLPPRHLASSISRSDRQPDIRSAGPGREVARAWHCEKGHQAPNGGPAGAAGPARGAGAVG